VQGQPVQVLEHGGRVGVWIAQQKMIGVVGQDAAVAGAKSLLEQLGATVQH
jgi:hypothetical protein